MSEPSSAVPGDIADAEVQPAPGESTTETVDLDLDEEKVEAWDEVKADYQVDPGGQAVPNSMAPTDFEPVEDEDEDDDEQ